MTALLLFILPADAPSTRFKSLASEVTPDNILILAGDAIISTPPICNFVAFTSPPEP